MLRHRARSDAKSNAGGVRLRRLVGESLDRGRPLEEAHRRAVEACQSPDVHGSWAHWEDLPDQDELRMRLEALAQYETIDGELVDFLTFFFRASDPESYRPAALALGRHLGAHDDLRTSIEAYADRMGVPFELPVVLDGERSRRRLLLAAAGRYAALSAEVRAERSLPLDLASSPSDVGADVAVRARAVAHLLEHGAETDELLEHAWHLVERAPRQVGPGTGPDSRRSVLKNWRSLLTTLAERDVERALDCWSRTPSRLVHASRSREHDTFAEHLVRWRELDEIWAVAPALVEAGARPEELRAGGESLDDGDVRRWGMLRISTWLDRQIDATWIPDEALDETERLDPVLEAYVDDLVEARRASETARTELGYRRIVRALERVTEPRSWRARPPGSRALEAFLLLDRVRYGPPDDATVVSMLDTFGLAPPESSASNGGRSLPGEYGLGLQRFVLELHLLEGASEPFPLESELVHAISHVETLLALLGGHRRDELLEVFADAIEHDLRIRLRATSEASLHPFFYRLLARKPHPELLHLLAERCRGRTYETHDGSTVPLIDVFEAMAGEIESAADDPFEAIEPEGRAPEWCPSAATVRGTAAALEEEPDLFECLTELADFIDPGLTGTKYVGAGFVDLVLRMHEPGSRLWFDSDRRHVPVEAEVFAEEVHELAHTIREGVPDVRPDSPELFQKSQSTGRVLVDRLRELERIVGGCLSAWDDALFASIVDRTVERLTRWLKALQELESIFEAIEANPGPTRPDDLDIEEAFACAEQLERGTTLQHFRELVYELWLDPVATTGEQATSVEAIRYEVQCLEAIERATERTEARAEAAWRDFRRERWESCVLRAMEERSESLVRRLSRDETFAHLRQHPASSAIVRQIQDWWSARYHAVAVLALEREQRTTSRWAPLAAACRKFLGYYNNVWMALLIGALLLLDFGDAWIDMAKTRDLGGIGFTFVLGVASTFAYLFHDLAGQNRAPEAALAPRRTGEWLLRIVGFLVVCLLYTTGIVSGLWYLFSGTDAVLRGQGAMLQILVWTGFALFVGVFFGLVASET